MAAKARFRVPTLEEMDEAEQQETVITSRPIFKKLSTSKSSAVSSDADADAALPKSSPPKRMISQKALLSRQPLSAQIKSKISPKKSVPGSSITTGSTGNNQAANSGDILGHHRVSHVTNDNVSYARLKPSSDTSNTDQLNRQPAKEQDKAPSNSSEQRTAAGTSNSDQTTGEQDAVRADVLPTLAKLGKTNSLVVNTKQRGNPILKYVRSVPWEYGNIVPDYVMGQSNCALYLSLRYHQLHPEYIHMRLKQLGHSFDLRVLLVQVDVKDPHHLLKDLAKICILADCTLMLAFSAEEAGRYLETYKVFENKAAEAIMERTDSNFNIQLTDCLTRVKTVNKTDCATLLATFGNLQGIMGASVENLSLCPGFGPQKAKRLHDVFREPFLVSKKQRLDAGK